MKDCLIKIFWIPFLSSITALVIHLSGLGLCLLLLLMKSQIVQNQIIEFNPGPSCCHAIISLPLPMLPSLT